MIPALLSRASHPILMGKVVHPSLYLGDPRLLRGLILLALTALIDCWLIASKQTKNRP